MLWTYGACGSDEGQLLQPTGVAVSADGDVYVADTGNFRVVHLNPQGEFVAAWGEQGEGPGQFTEVYDLAVTPEGQVAALDAVNQVVSLWTPTGEFERQFGAELTMYRPRGMGVSPTGDFVLADTGGVRVLQVVCDRPARATNRRPGR